jgi:hypothetical protein
MGLFGGRDADSLRELLSAMHGSTLRDIDAIQAGNPPPPRGPLPDMQLNSRIDKASALTVKLCQKGKQPEADTILTEFAAKPVERAVFFRATQVGGFDAAAAAAAKELEELGPDPEQDEKNRQWRAVIDEIRKRTGIDASVA